MIVMIVMTMIMVTIIKTIQYRPLIMIIAYSIIMIIVSGRTVVGLLLETELHPLQTIKSFLKQVLFIRLLGTFWHYSLSCLSSFSDSTFSLSFFSLRYFSTLLWLLWFCQDFVILIESLAEYFETPVFNILKFNANK